MKYALFLGCKIPSKLPAYETSMRAVLGHLGVTLVDLEFDCCGYPARNVSRDAFVASAAHNLALAERAGLNVLTPCSCCFGTLRHAMQFLTEDAQLRARVAQALAAEGLAWSGSTEVEHLLPVLARKVGMDALDAAIRTPRTGLRVAAQYGCHTLRPSNVARVDSPLAPTIFETLITVTGATAAEGIAVSLDADAGALGGRAAKGIGSATAATGAMGAAATGFHPRASPCACEICDGVNFAATLSR